MILRDDHFASWFVLSGYLLARGESRCCQLQWFTAFLLVLPPIKINGICGWLGGGTINGFAYNRLITDRQCDRPWWGGSYTLMSKESS